MLVNDIVIVNDIDIGNNIDNENNIDIGNNINIGNNIDNDIIILITLLNNYRDIKFENKRQLRVLAYVGSKRGSILHTPIVCCLKVCIIFSTLKD